MERSGARGRLSGKPGWYIERLMTIGRSSMTALELGCKMKLGHLVADEEVVANNFTPLMVDRSLGQMRKLGLKYASIPEPVFQEWANWCSDNGSRLSWRDTCITATEDAETRSITVDVDDDGNVLLCLLDRGHSGPCGHAFLM